MELRKKVRKVFRKREEVKIGREKKVKR